MDGGRADGAGPAGDHRDQHAIDVSGVLIPMVTRRASLATPGAAVPESACDPLDPRPVVIRVPFNPTAIRLIRVPST